jgi:dihydroflavonol-4-reductase
LNNPAVPIAPYQKSKTIAERGAWDWIEKEGGPMELTVVNPVAVIGPVLGKDIGTSAILISRLMNGELPGIPNIGFNIVDVRDVAEMHLQAMTHSKAPGERFLAVSDDDFLWVKDVAEVLRSKLGDKAKKVPTRSVPNVLVRIIGWFDKAVGLIAPELGKSKNYSNEKAKSVFGFKPRTAEDSIVSCAESLEQFGVIQK